ncbi:TolC family protein [Autumnicola musiva]|uniref:TolC family protein n=1 Tax=Autumnicola musiva TaxID=3075589 RepID=A0ABU3DB73_9FLAO|nr:TolC family protein [Zunongwangia sp. F117]MDT0678605.1 TolC family protein [Zunongwangia sp. F117]
MSKFIIIITIFFSGILKAQDQNLSLNECIKIALEENISLKRSNLNAETSKIFLRQSKSALLPGINANYNLGINNGRSIDPYTNDYIDQQLKFSNAGIDLSSQLFKGFELLNSIQRDRYNWKASQAEAEEAKQQLILQVTLAYFQVLNNRDLVELSQLRMKATKDQMQRLENLYAEGEGNPADFTDIQGQINADAASLLEAQNALLSAKLELANLLNRDEDFQVNNLTSDSVTPYVLSVEEVYTQALENFPGFEADQLRIDAAEENVAVAKSLYIPEISLFAQVNSNYSSVARIYNENGTEVIQTGQFIMVGENNYPVQTNQALFAEEKISYLDQLNNNLNSVVGLSVSIPIFNGFRAKQQVDLRKIELEDSRLELEATKNDLEQEIKLAYNQMQTAYKNYFILKDQVQAYNESYRVNEIRFRSGVSNFVEYIISKNNLDRAKINLTNSLYEYIIRRKILDYYSAKNNSLNFTS